jgi:serine O-acetyltransferase
MFDQLIRINCHARSTLMRRLAGQLLEKLYGCEIRCEQIDRSVRFAHHARGCTIVAAKILEDVVIFQNVTLGANLRFNRLGNAWENVGNPIICRGVIICDGAKVLGPIVIGEDSVVAAGAIITQDVPAGSIAYGFNQSRAKDANFDLVFAPNMPDAETMVEANRRLIEDFEKSRAARPA